MVKGFGVRVRIKVGLGPSAVMVSTGPGNDFCHIVMTIQDAALTVAKCECERGVLGTTVNARKHVFLK